MKDKGTTTISPAYYTDLEPLICCDQLSKLARKQDLSKNDHRRHPGTALATGRDLQVISKEEHVYTGRELENLDGPELQQVVKTSRQFARVAPEHKLKLVKALQANGEVVAMTGEE